MTPIMSSDQKSRLILTLQALLMATIPVAPQFEHGFFRGLSLSPSLFTVFGSVLVVGGAALVIAAFRLLRRNLRAHPKPAGSATLVTTWPFSFTRNPVYLGLLVMAIGWSLWQQSLFAGALTLLLHWVLEIKIRLEEFYLRQQFGAAYVEYMARVPRFLPLRYRP
jgi:protein-S-isoprenylcysteine O-methyltransferase Ste14